MGYQKKIGTMLGVASVMAAFPAVASDFAGETNKWKSETEAGLVVAKGNTNVQTYTAKSASAYSWESNSVRLNGAFLRSSDTGQVKAKSWLLGLRFEHAYSERLSDFAGEAVEGDRFQNVKQKYNTDVGVKYYTVKAEKTYWFAELGYRYTLENQTQATLHQNKVRGYTEAEQKFGPGTSAKLSIEVLPNLSDGRNWELNSDASVSSLLSSVFSLKTSYSMRYDNEPAPGTIRNTDHIVTTALVAKF